MKVNVLFPNFGNACRRMYNSMMKTLPDDIQIIEALRCGDVHTKEANYADFTVCHLSIGMHVPSYAYISPKAIISEYTDDATLSYLRDRDIIFTYFLDTINRIQDKGLNVVLWPRPVDPDIFYVEPCDRIRDIVMIEEHGFTKRIHNVIEKIGGKDVLLSRINWDFDFDIEQDYCIEGQENAKMRSYYNSSKYVMCLMNGHEYYPGLKTYGIEVGNVEGAFCGCIPIILDAPGAEYYKYWYGDFAKVVRADYFEKDLEKILTEEYRPMPPGVISVAVERFNAEKIWGEFWSAVKGVLS